MTPAIASLVGVITLLGAVTIVVLSTRLRHEIADLFRAFDRAERALTPLVATVRTDRERLAQRLAELAEPGADPTHR
jgi:hypothetical protein